MTSPSESDLPTAVANPRDYPICRQCGLSIQGDSDMQTDSYGLDGEYRFHFDCWLEKMLVDLAG